MCVVRNCLLSAYGDKANNVHVCVCVSACIRLAVLNRLHARFGLTALSYAFPGISPWLWSKFSGFFSTQTHTRMRGIHPYLERLERFLIPAGSEPYLRAW